MFTQVTAETDEMFGIVFETRCRRYRIVKRVYVTRTVYWTLAVSSSSSTLSRSEGAGDGGTTVMLGRIISGLGERSASSCRSTEDADRRSVDDRSPASRCC